MGSVKEFIHRHGITTVNTRMSNYNGSNRLPEIASLELSIHCACVCKVCVRNGGVVSRNSSPAWAGAPFKPVAELLVALRGSTRPVNFTHIPSGPGRDGGQVNTCAGTRGSELSVWVNDRQI